MPFCPNCGRPLSENEVCSCAAQNPQQPYPNQQGYPNPQMYQNGQPYLNQQGNPNPQMYQNGQPYLNQQGYPNPQMYQNGQSYPNQQIYGQPQPQKKSSSGCLIALAICIPVFLVMAGILAAILVPSMLGYVKKSKISAANNAAKNFNNVANSVLVDLYSEDINITGSYIITSGFADNINVTIDAEDFLDRVGYYSVDAKDYDYFFVFEDGKCVYTAAVAAGETYTGTYPQPATAAEGPVNYSGVHTGSAGDIRDCYRDACAALTQESEAA